MGPVFVRLDGQGKIVMKILKNVIIQDIVQPIQNAMNKMERLNASAMMVSSSLMLVRKKIAFVSLNFNTSVVSKLKSLL
jgi:hypothetical protein